MRIRSIEVANIKGIEYVKFEPGCLTLIEGANGTGKSSIIDAIRMVFDGGTDPGWLRKGQRKGYVSLDTDTGVVITKAVTEKGSKLEIVDADGVPVPAPQAFVNQLASALAVDPVKLLNPGLKPRDIAKILLEVMPIEFTMEEFTAACGDCPNELTLAGCDSLSKTLYDKRTAINRQAKEAEATATQLRKSLGADDDTDWGAAVLEFERVKREHESDLATVMAQLKEEAAAKIDAINRQLVLDCDKVRDTAKPDIEAVVRDLATAREKQASQQKIKGARETIDKMNAKARETFLEGEALTGRIKKLAALKASKLASLPIAGLTFDGDEFLVDGVQWDHVNSARRTDIALQVAVLKAGELRLMALDDAEHLDTDGLENLKAGAEKLGFQIIAARVTDSELQVQV